MAKTDAVDREVPDVIDDLAPIGPWAMTKVDPAAELQAFEAAAALLAKLVPASIRATRPQDWVKMGDKVYLQATGVERLAPLWGLVFGEPEVIREDYPPGTDFAYVVRGPVGSRRTGVFYRVIEGGRSSLDPFFDSYDEDKPHNFRQLSHDEQAAWKAKHRVAPDPLDVRKAAVTNWMTRAASMLCGMRNLTPADLEANGIKGVSEVQYRGGAKGGDASPDAIKAERVKFSNEILAATGGDKEAARKTLKEVTAGKDFAGFDTVEGIKHQWQIDNGRKKLAEHPIFGKKAQREPGDEAPGA